MTNQLVEQVFLIVPRTTLETLLQKYPNLDYSNNDALTTTYTLIRAESNVEQLREELENINSDNDTPMFAQVILTRIPSKEALPDWADYEKFRHQYMWGEMQSRGTLDQMEVIAKLSGLFSGNGPLGQILTAIAGARTIAEGDEAAGPCDDPNCMFCHPETALANMKDQYTEQDEAETKATFVKGNEAASSDSFFVNGSKSVH